MLRFLNPRLYTMDRGDWYLELTESGDWTSFPAFVEVYVSQIGASVVKKIEGPDVHLWVIQYEGVALNLVYEDFPNSISVNAVERSDCGVIEKLYQLALSEMDPEGM